MSHARDMFPRRVLIPRTLQILTLAVNLFHHLLIPHFNYDSLIIPSSAQRRRAHALAGLTAPPVGSQDGDQVKRPVAINLVSRMRDPVIKRDFVGLDHQFISALGLMGWSTPSHDVDAVDNFDLADIQGKS